MKENSLDATSATCDYRKGVATPRNNIYTYIHIYIYIYIYIETQDCAAICSLRWILKKFYSGLSPASRNTAITEFYYSEHK